MPDEEVDYKKLYEREKEKVVALGLRLSAFELPGKTKLFYALNKQQNDMADMLNQVELKDLNLGDKDNKTIERLRVIWSSIGTLAPLVDMLAANAGVSGDEEGDMKNRKALRVITTPESMANQINSQ